MHLQEGCIGMRSALSEVHWREECIGGQVMVPLQQGAGDYKGGMGRCLPFGLPGQAG